VASGEHHHHDDDGSMQIHDSEGDASESEQTAAGTIGHSHLASTAVDAVAQFSSNIRALVLEPGPTPAAANTPALETLGWSPQKRPPRTA
jgi:hypothetical protein